MAAVTTTTVGLASVSHTPASATDWEIVTFPFWVNEVYVTPVGAAGHWSTSAGGTFSAAGTEQHSIAADRQYLIRLQPKGSAPRLNSIRLFHDSGLSGEFLFELRS